MPSDSFFKTNADESATVTLSDGTKVGFPKLRSDGSTAQDIQNLLRGILDLIENLDKRIAALEKRRASAAVPGGHSSGD